jgi:hypothetical protein
MNCRRCDTEMTEGTAMVPVWGNYSNRVGRGVTIYPITAALRTVKKCTNCGHSISFEGMIYGTIREIPVKTRRLVTIDVPALEEYNT